MTIMQNALRMLQGSQGQSLADIGSMGAQETQDINSQFNAAQGRATNQLMSAGMGNATVTPSLGALYGREKQSALQRLMSQLSQERAGVREKYSGMMSSLYGQKMQEQAAQARQNSATPDFWHQLAPSLTGQLTHGLLQFGLGGSSKGMGYEANAGSEGSQGGGMSGAVGKGLAAML